MAEPSPKPAPMTVAEFLHWSESWADGERHELVEGVPVAMAPERSRHALVKSDVDGELKRAVAAAGAPCTVWPDRMTVAVDETTAFGPDSVVESGRATPLDSVTVEAPAIVVEVLSSTTRGADTGKKLTGYFSLPSLAHYLVVDPARKVVTRHSRRPDGGIDTAILREGTMRLDPPGIDVALAAFFARV
jgi:Uma2 family endonuclease